MEEKFRKIACKVSEITGSPNYFIFWLILTVLWLGWGPIRGFDDTWNFWANTPTTVLTFLMLSLLQNAQNRSTKEIELKLDEIIRSSKPAKNKFIDLGALSNTELQQLEEDIKNCISEGDCKVEKL